MTEYDVEVKLLAVTRLTADSKIPSSRLKIPSIGSSDAEALIEYAGRLCWDTQGQTGSIPDRIQKWIDIGHESMIEHASATFYIRASRIFTHELVRHRIASYSQRSQRYVREDVPRYTTPPELIGKVVEQDELDKCIMSSGIPGFFRSFKNSVDVAGTSFRTVLAIQIYDSFMKLAWVVYGLLLKSGLNPEIARYVLPGACETQIICTWNFRELRHIIRLRTSPRALPEMRVVAGKIREICKEIAPQVFEDL